MLYSSIQHVGVCVCTSTLHMFTSSKAHLVLSNVRVADSSSNELGHLEAGDLAAKQLIPSGQPHIVGSLVGVCGPFHTSRPDYDIWDATGLESLLGLLLEGQNAPKQVQETCR